jgi:hypothetical protein
MANTPNPDERTPTEVPEVPTGTTGEAVTFPNQPETQEDGPTLGKQSQARTAEGKTRIKDPPFTPPPDPTDESALATVLRKAKKRKQARLVEFMIGKDEAEIQTIAEEVHEYSKTSDDAVEKNARATSDSAASLGYRMKYFVRSGRVFKETAAE